MEILINQKKTMNVLKSQEYKGKKSRSIKKNADGLFP